MKPTPNSPPDSPFPHSPFLLAFGAHPDDIEFGCGGIIASETRAGRMAHFVVCSRGEAATHGTPKQRMLKLTMPPQFGSDA
jgi:LmbE family N-acetylglucosaminyl deacetylase